MTLLTEILFYGIQVVSIIFAVVLAKHDAPAVIHFENKGVDPLTMAKFHRYNVWVKSLFHVVCALPFLPDLKTSIASGLLSFLWVWLLFDIALNKSRPGRSWDYIGENDADGRRWIEWFGKKAGEWKAVILSIGIVSVNVLKYII